MRSPGKLGMTHRGELGFLLQRETYGDPSTRFATSGLPPVFY